MGSSLVNRLISITTNHLRKTISTDHTYDAKQRKQLDQGDREKISFPRRGIVGNVVDNQGDEAAVGGLSQLTTLDDRLIRELISGLVVGGVGDQVESSNLFRDICWQP